MHPAVRTLFLALSALACTQAATPIHEATLTIVMDFEGPHTSASITQMKQEFAGIMKDSGLRVDWRLRAEANDMAFDNLVVVKFKGKCIFEPVGYLYDERGPLAMTHTSEGEVLPFSEVACGKVTSAMRSAMFGGDYNHADELLGRALARVVAHEVIHILSNSGTHGREGIAREAFSGRQLIGNNLRLSPEDLKRIQPADRP